MTRRDKFVTNFVTVARRLSVDCFATGKEGRRAGAAQADVLATWRLWEGVPGGPALSTRVIYTEGQTTNRERTED